MSCVVIQLAPEILQVALDVDTTKAGAEIRDHIILAVAVHIAHNHPVR